MPFRFFFISAVDPGSTETELNTFLNAHRVLQIDKYFVDAGRNSYWAICVDFVDCVSKSRNFGVGSAKSRTDYKEILTAEQFSRFARLRELRAKIAKDEAIPPYAIFTNEQLAAIVTGNMTTAAQMAGIPGVGDARVAKYADAFLELLKGDGIEASKPPV